MTKARATRQCAICGTIFEAPPSANKSTCSDACSSVYRSQRHKGISNKWSAAGRAHAREAATRTGNLQNGTAAALQDPRNRRGPQNREAKVWHLRDPDGHTVTVVNLQDWARRHAWDYFGMESTDKNAQNIASGLRQIKRSMEGKIRRKGRPVTVSSYKGWQLLAWEDKADD